MLLSTDIWYTVTASAWPVNYRNGTHVRRRFELKALKYAQNRTVLEQWYAQNRTVVEPWYAHNRTVVEQWYALNRIVDARQTLSAVLWGSDIML